ncbi:MAG: TssN family type VI secretion system protein [Chitinophagales bacterium]
MLDWKPAIVNVVFMAAGAAFGALFFYFGKNELSKYKKHLIVHTLLVALISALWGTVGFLVAETPRLAFSIAQFLFLFLGLGHTLGIYLHQPWSSRTGFKKELFFSLSQFVVAALVFTLVIQFTAPPAYRLLFTFAALPFLIPFLFMKLFDFAMMIPMLIYKRWFYPVEDEMPDADDIDMTQPIVLAFQFQKRMKDASYTNFRAKAPQRLGFGQLFFFFINDYNERHPESIIEYLDPHRQPSGWVFYVKNPWWKPNRFIDPHQTIQENTLKEDDIVICTRVYEQLKPTAENE